MADTVMVENQVIETKQKLSQLQVIQQGYNEIIAMHFSANIQDIITFERASQFVGLYEKYKAESPEELNHALTMVDNVKRLMPDALHHNALNGLLREASPEFMQQVDRLRNRVGRYTLAN